MKTGALRRVLSGHAFLCGTKMVRGPLENQFRAMLELTNIRDLIALFESELKKLLIVCRPIMFIGATLQISTRMNDGQEARMYPKGVSIS
jgi:hypothetical protein